MPLITTIGGLSDRGLGGFGARPRGFKPSLLCSPNVGSFTGDTVSFSDFVLDSQGNYIGLFIVTIPAGTHPDYNSFIVKVSAQGELLAWINTYTEYFTRGIYDRNPSSIIRIDNSDNIYVVTSLSVTAYNSSLTQLWQQSYDFGTNFIIDMNMSDSSVLTVTDGYKIMSINPSNGAITQTRTGSGSTYQYSRAVSYCLISNGSNSQNVYLGNDSYFLSTLGKFSLSIIGAAGSSVTIKFLSQPSTFTSGVYTFNIGSYVGALTYVSDHATYNASTGASSYYIAGLYTYTGTWASGGTTQPTRYYVASFYSTVTMVGSTVTVSAPVGFNLYTTGGPYSGEISYIDKNGNFFTVLWTGSAFVIVRYDITTSSILWSNSFAPQNGLYTTKIKFQYDSVNNKFFLGGDKGYIEFPGDGSIPGTGTYTLAGTTYTYQPFTLTNTGTTIWSYNTTTTTSTILTGATTTETLGSGTATQPTLNTLVVY